MEEFLGTSCFDLWKLEEETPKLITLCKELDQQLGGGIEMCKITEFCGGSGSGKTQICLQLCINVQFPIEVGGIGGKACYIDTNQDFHPQRLKQIAECMEQRFRKTFSQQSQTKQSDTGAHKFTCDTMLQNITYTYCRNYEELMAAVLQLEQDHDPLMKLLIIDSFSFTMRQIDNVSLRTNIVYELLTYLHRLAMTASMAIVITNELTTRIKDNGDHEIVPALGETHAHKINERILVSNDDSGGKRYVNVGKHMQLLKPAVTITIKPGGVR